MEHQAMIQPHSAMIKPHPVSGDDDDEIPIGSRLSQVTEYPLPMAMQTHELVFLPEENALIVTQQTSNSILAMRINLETGRPINVKKILSVPWGAAQGPHGLLVSKTFPGSFWCTLQYANKIELVTLREEKLVSRWSIKMPKGVRGPHCLAEDEHAVWVTCKDSSHLVAFSTNAYPRAEPVNQFRVSARPIFVAVTERYIYSSLDLSSSIFCFNKTSDERTEVSVEAMGRTPVGLVTGPDGNAWFTLLEGAAGTFGRLSGTEIQWFRLKNRFGGLIHLAFDPEALEDSLASDPKDDKPIKVWLLGSSMAEESSLDTVYTATVDHRKQPPSVVDENFAVITSKNCKAHRLLVQKSGVFVTELGNSTVAHITGAGVRGLGEGKLSDRRGAFGNGFIGDSAVYSVDGPQVAGAARGAESSKRPRTDDE